MNAGKKLSDDCKKELAAFKIDLGTNINMNLPLANACKDDSTKFCAGEDPTDPGAVLACLRSALLSLAQLKHVCSCSYPSASELASSNVHCQGHSECDS